MKKYHRLVSPYIKWLVIFLGIVAIFLWTPPAQIIPPQPALYVFSALAFVYWLYFFMKGSTANLQASFRPHHITKVVTTGIYARLRHPIYSADIVLAWGIVSAYPTLPVYLSAMWVTMVLLTWIYLEELSLMDLFESKYQEYRSAVPMLFPVKRK